MIPPFNELGFLPPGIHLATLEEIDVRFGHASELRRVQMESVRWLIQLARRVGVQRIVLNGSFVTDIIEPNDVDCVLLVAPGGPADALADEELNAGLPFLDIALVGQVDFDRFVGKIFAAGRFGEAKGMIEVIQWS
jgi:hypothetical protein